MKVEHIIFSLITRCPACVRVSHCNIYPTSSAVALPAIGFDALCTFALWSEPTGSDLLPVLDRKNRGMIGK